MSQCNVRILLAVIIIVFVALAFGYNRITPAATSDQHNPDENAHMLYVQSLASGQLPVFHTGENAYESHQPPLYYVICTPIYLAMHTSGDETATRTVRCVSILLGALMILFTYLCVITLFPSEPLVALGTAAFVAFLPMNVAQSASVTNDTLTNLIVAIALWLVARFVMSTQEALDQKRWDRQAISLGVILGLGILTKSSRLLLFPTVFLTLALLVRQKVVSSGPIIRFGSIALGLGLLIGSPWLIRNTMLYGDPLAQHIFETAFGNTAKADAIAPLFGSIGGYLAGVAKWTFASYWGVFDSMSLFWGQDPLRHHAPSLLNPLSLTYNVITGFIAVSFIGLLVFLRRRPSSLSVVQRIVLISFVVLIGLTGLAFFRFILVFFQAQGRYWYPALVPLSLLFVLGWRGFFSKQSLFQISIVLIILALLALNAYTLFVLLPSRFGV